MPNWKPAQLEAINARGGTIIVSAAAGSGKTAVLTERIATLLENGETSLDRLLIVTFTRSATAEMKDRIGKAIDEHIQKTTDQEIIDRLNKQKILLPSANISTIDSFCGNIVKSHFQQFPGLAPDYEIIDNIEAKTLRLRVLNDILDEYYDTDDKDFLDLIRYFAAGSTTDEKLISTVLKLYDNSRSYTSPEEWLKNAAKIYDPEVDFKDSPLVDALINYKLEDVDYYINEMEKAIKFFETYEDKNILNTPGYNLIKTELEILYSNREILINKDFHNLEKVNQGTWGAKGYTDIPKVNEIKNTRLSATKVFDDISAKAEDEFHTQCKTIYKVASKLIEITLKFEDRFLSAKIDQNTLEFSDVALMALSLLVDEDTRKQNSAKATINRTTLAEDISKDFDFILIDEYQDTNVLQDMLFRAISQNEDNLFMVGDVKQSIYRFRQAMPDIFIDKCENYKEYKINKIILGENFRSRDGIINFVNYVFEQLCTKNCGDVNYDENEKLIYANPDYKPNNEEDVELHVFQAEGAADSLVREGRFIAKYIKKHTKENKNYKDFTILMRAPGSGNAEVICKELSREGIPYYNAKESGFLDTTDVQTVIALLKVIDNPLNDIPLLTVLLSPIFNLTPDDVAKFRLNKDRERLYQSILKEEQAQNPKAQKVLNEIRKYRRLSISLSAGELIRKIYEDTLYQSVAGALPNGQQRTANLLLLQTYADTYDKTNSLGISGFIRYLDKIMDSNENIEPASLSSENSNVVQITSIHSSKGLQYKYCILAGTGSQMNTMDYANQVLLNPKFGIGLKGYDPENYVTYKTIANSTIAKENEAKAKSEHLRLLYVALTRAKEKLIITGSISSDMDKKLEKIKNSSELDSSGRQSPKDVRGKSSMLELMLSALLHKPDYKSIVTFHDLEDLTLNEVQDEIKEAKPNNKITEDIRERQSYKYPYEALAKVPTKRAASATEAAGFNEKFFASARPEFASKQGLTPSQRGTALHTFMQYADLTKDLNQELKRLENQRFITPEQAKVIDLNKVTKYKNSNIYQRILNSDNIYREKKFAVLIPALKLNPNLNEELGKEKILIQGIADLVFEENNGIIILDYKTDRTKNEQELIDRHTDQIKTYAEALEQIFGKPVTEAYLYAFSLDKEIKII